jgi:hypothetical protein
MPDVTVYDIENYPNNSKTVSVDLQTIVPARAEGDEKWVLVFSTEGYSDNVLYTEIDDVYVRNIKSGWVKSSGFTGTRFTIDNSSRTLGIKIDNSNTVYYIELTTGVNITGDSIASDMQNKIRAVPDSVSWQEVDSDYESAYRNALVDFEDGKFVITSGSISGYYTGDDKSSVYVTSSGVDSCYKNLGFNLNVSSEILAGVSLKEVLITESYVANTSDLKVNSGSGASEGCCFYITDGTNCDYFTAISGTTDTTIKVCTSGNNGYQGIKHNYSVSDVAKVQLIRENDPDFEPNSYHVDIDSVVRWGLMNMINELDFSS